jgi:hypothetical protein
VCCPCLPQALQCGTTSDFLVPYAAQAYYLPTSVAVAGVAKVLVCGLASLSLFGALLSNKVSAVGVPLASHSKLKNTDQGSDAEGLAYQELQRSEP